MLSCVRVLFGLLASATVTDTIIFSVKLQLGQC